MWKSVENVVRFKVKILLCSKFHQNVAHRSSERTDEVAESLSESNVILKNNLFLAQAGCGIRPPQLDIPFGPQVV